MKMRFVLAVVCSTFALAVPAVAEKAPKAADLLFNTKHLNSVKKGDALNYRFARTSENTRQNDTSFEDDIVIEITNETAEKTKNVKLKVFTGDRARSSFETPGMTGNPLLIWYLDRCVATYNKVAGGSAMYLKGKFRKALGEDASVEAAKFDYNGKSIDGYKIKLLPFINDPAKNRMHGYEVSNFELLVSDQVPGFFYGMTANYYSRGKGTAKYVERISLKSLGEIK